MVVLGGGGSFDMDERAWSAIINRVKSLKVAITFGGCNAAGLQVARERERESERESEIEFARERAIERKRRFFIHPCWLA